MNMLWSSASCRRSRIKLSKVFGWSLLFFLLFDNLKEQMGWAFLQIYFPELYALAEASLSLPLSRRHVTVKMN